MSFLSHARFVARPLARRASTWETIAKVMPTSRKTDFNQTVAAFQKRKEKANAAVSDANIDFDKYKAILGDAEVEAIRKEFENHKYTDFETEKNSELAKVKSALQTTIAAIEAQSASLTAAAAAASTELTQLERTRTTLRTTADEVHRRHPEIIADLQARLADEDWDTEEKPLDVNALRLETLTENWDEKALGALDEKTQKEFIDEMTALDEEASAVAADDELPDVLKELIADSAKNLGLPADFAALKAAAAANTVTAADRAITSESTLYRQIDEAVEAGQIARAEGLIAIAKELRHTGRLAIDEEFRELEKKKLHLALAHLKVDTPVTAEEIEGKSAAELAELSAAAEAQDDVYRASQLLYASQVAAGKIDPKNTDISTYSGIANLIIQQSKASVAVPKSLLN